MKNKIILILITILLLLPVNAEALSRKYKDVVSKITEEETIEGKINIYLFHGAECPHCKEEQEWLKKIKTRYSKYINIVKYEVWHDEKNAENMKKVSEKLDADADGVPFTIIGENYFIGYSETIASKMETKIKEYAQIKQNKNEIKLPILGKVNMKKVSIPLVAVILGLIDGFNPCAMWILLFLINMLFGMKNRKKAWILGITFLVVSGCIYFMSMLGMNLILAVSTVNILKIAIGLFILFTGILNIKKYVQIRNEENGCTVVDDKKRKKLITKMKKIINEKSFALTFVGIVLLACSVNLIELACSLGFPMIFTEILSINDITGAARIMNLILYIIFYMLDDMIVFTISMVTLQATGITNKYNKLCTLISAIIMIIMGLLLLFKQEWLMLNF